MSQFSNDAPYHNAQKQFADDAAKYGEFVGTVPGKHTAESKMRYFYNDRITWSLSGKYATRKDEKTGRVDFYHVEEN